MSQRIERRLSNHRHHRNRKPLLRAASHAALRPMLESLEARQLLSETVHWALDELDPVYYQVMDQSFDNITDLQNNASPSSTSFVPGKTGNAVQFTGTYSYLMANYTLDPIISGTATVAFWIKTTQVGSNTMSAAPGILGGGNGSGTNEVYWGILDGTGRIGLGVGTQQIKSTSPINDDKWHHVAMTRNSATGAVALYVDGVLNANGTFATGEQFINRYDSYVGTMQSQEFMLYGGFTGLLDEFWAYDDKVLTPTEIANLYAPAPSATAKGPFRIDLSWSDNSGAAVAYKIERSTSLDGAYEEIARPTVTAYTDNSAYPGTTYYYKISGLDSAGQSSPIGQVNTTTQTLPTGPGLLGTYFDNTSLRWAPAFWRVDGDTTTTVTYPAPYPTIQTGVINWQDMDAAPTTPLNTGVAAIDDGENFSIRWEGTFRAPATGAYTFFTRTDDDVRLYFDGKILVAMPNANNFFAGRGAPALPLTPGQPGQVSDISAPVNLVAGQTYPIILEYRQGTGSAVAELRCKGPAPVWNASDPELILSVNGTPTGASQVLTATVTAPAAPSSLRGVPTRTTMNLSWQDNANNEFLNRVEWSGDGGVTWTAADKSGVDASSAAPYENYTPSYTVTGLTAGKSYQFRVTAINTAGAARSQILTQSTLDPEDMNATVANSSGDTDLSAEGNLGWSHYGQGGNPATWVSSAGSSPVMLVLPDAQSPARPWITNVVETGGDNEATDTITAKWSGQTWLTTVDNEPLLNTPAGTSFTLGTFQNGAPAMVDRAHQYCNASATVPIPSYLVDGEYIMVGNDNKDNVDFKLDVSVSVPVAAYLLVDNRLTDTSSANPPVFDATHMQWVMDQGWTPAITGLNRAGNASWPDEVGIDENADGSVNNWYSVYMKILPAGTFSLYKDDANGNIYGVVVKPIPSLAPAETGTTTFSWTNGTPIATATATNDAVAASGVGNGVHFSIPASNLANRVLKVYVAADDTTGQFTATTSDTSLRTYTDTSVVDSGPGVTTKVYTLVFRPETTGSITIDWVSLGSGKVILSAVALGEVEPPLAPDGLVAAQVDTTARINVTWADNAVNETAYKLERKEGADGEWVQIAQLPPDTTTYRDSDASLGAKQYFYRVRATGAYGDSAYSNEGGASLATVPSIGGASQASSGDTTLSAEPDLINWAHWGQGLNAGVMNTSARPALIANVVETGGDNTTRTPPAKWTGQTWTTTTANEPTPNTPVGTSVTAPFFGLNAPMFVDRTHCYKGYGTASSTMPSYLIGGEYIMSGNEDRENANYRLDVTISAAARVYMLIDNRLSDGDGATPPTFDATHMQWIRDEGWIATANGINRAGSTARPDEVGADEGSDGSINQWFSVYYKDFPAGVFTLRQADNASRNMYGVVITYPTPAGIALGNVGAGTRSAIDAPGKTFSWTNGSPNSTISQTDDAVSVAGAGNGFKFSVPASTTQMQQLKLYVGVDDTQGQLAAVLSDRGMVSYTDSSLVDSGPGIKTYVYTINFQAQQPDQTLDVTWKSLGTGSVIISAATVQKLTQQDITISGSNISISTDGTNINWTADGTTGSKPISGITAIHVTGTAGDDTLTIDNTGGNPLLAGSSVDLGDGAGDTVLFKGLNGDVDLTSISAALAGAENVGFGDGSVRLAVVPAGMGLVLKSGTVELQSSATLPYLDIASGAKLSLSSGGDKVLVVNAASPTAVNVAGTLDLADNDAIIQTASAADRDALLATLSGLIGAARNGGTWNHAGITSSAAQTDSSGLTGLAISGGEGLPAWTGQSFDANSVLIKYTFNGDADLNGMLDGSDYFFIDKGYLARNMPNPPSGYHNGDFDLNGIIDGSDYFLIDKAFLAQKIHVPPAPLAAVAAPAASMFSAKPIATAKAVLKKLARKHRVGR